MNEATTTAHPATAYKVLTAAEMTALEHEGSFAGSADDRRDGFVHLSTAEQLAGTLDRHFAGRNDVWIAAVDLAALGEAVVWEVSRGGALFPHLYAALPLDALIAYEPLHRDKGGAPRLPVAG